MASAKGPGLLQRAWVAVRNAVMKEQLVGRDANGNQYYKWLETIDGVPVEKRRVRVPGNSILYDPKTLAPEWRMWLHKTRLDAPTEEEMARAAERASVMKARIAAIDQREAARRFRAETLGQQGQAAGAPDVAQLAAQLGHAPQGSGAVAQRQPPGGGSQAAYQPDAWRPGGSQQQQQAGGSTQGPESAATPTGAGEPVGGGDKFKPGTWRPG